VTETRYINYYRCPDDGSEWTMTWSCMCDDRCPTCSHEIVPYKSEVAVEAAIAEGEKKG